MTLKERTRKAFLEDSNIVVLAGSIALSFALLTPVPALVAFVAEAAYLLYVPDSRGYGLHLLRRYDRETVKRRAHLRKTQSLASSSSATATLDQLDALRAAVSRQKATDDAPWLTLLRSVDALLNELVTTQGMVDRIIAHIAQGDNTGAGIARRIKEHEKNLGYYETTTKVLGQIVQDLDDAGSQSEFRANLAQVTQQQNDTQRDLFRIVAAQHLIEAANQAAVDTVRLLEAIAREDGIAPVADWQTRVEQLTRESQVTARRFHDWVAQSQSKLLAAPAR